MISVPFFIFFILTHLQNWENWDRVKTDFDQKHYSQALEELLKQPSASLVYFFNLGILSFHTGDLGKARAYLEKALSLKPGDPEIQRNLSFIQSQWKLKQGEIDSISRPIDFFLEKSTLSKLRMILGLTSLMSLVLGLAYYAQLRSFILTLKKPIWISLLIFSGIGLILEQVASQWVSPVAFLLQTQVVRSGPGKDYTEVTELPSGSKVRYLYRSQSWVQIRYSREEVGWVPHSALLRL